MKILNVQFENHIYRNVFKNAAFFHNSHGVLPHGREIVRHAFFTLNLNSP